MGSGQSKSVSDADKPLWKPVTGSLADDLAALKSGDETDASRVKAIEAQIQKRIAADMQRIHAEAEAAARETVPAILDRASSETADDTHPGRHVISNQVETLRSRLDNQKRRRERAIPSSVESARQDVARCLREKDRKPLDCWREVELFRKEVGKLERDWVESTS